MNCRRYEEQIALHVGGDLAREEILAVESHLARCASCRALLDELRRTQALLADLGGEQPAEIVLARVRTRVMARASARGRWRPVAAAAAVFLAVAAGALWRLLPGETAGPPTWAEVRKFMPMPAAPEVSRARRLPAAKPARGRSPAPPGRSRRSSHREPAPPPEQRAEPLVVKLYTDDPEVVIYWIVNGTGD